MTMNDTGAVQEPVCETPSGFQRTIVFMKFTSQPGQQLFLRGGISYSRRPRMLNAILLEN